VLLILGTVALLASLALPAVVSAIKESSEFADVRAAAPASVETAASSGSVPQGANPDHHVHVQFCTS